MNGSKIINMNGSKIINMNGSKLFNMNGPKKNTANAEPWPNGKQMSKEICVIDQRN